MSRDSEKYKALFKDTVIFALGNIGSKVIIFFLVPFYTYYLTPDEYGVSDLVFTVSQLAIPFFSLVIFDAVIRFALLRKERPQDTLLVGIFIWVIGSALAFLMTPLFGLYKAIAEWKWFVTSYISVSMLVSIELNYLKATNRNLLYSIICIAQTLCLACLNILLVAHFRLGIRGYLISSVGASLIAAILALLFGGVINELKKARYDKELARQMIAYSTPLILNNLSWWVIQSSDKIMLELMIDKAALGIYTVASRIPSLITVFVTIFQQAWGISSIREMDSSNDKGFYTSVFTFYSFIAFFGGIALCTIIKPFMDIYVQSDLYGDVWRYVPLLLASAVFSALAAYNGSMYGALKKSMNNMLSTLTAAIVNLIVNYITILLFGIWGAMIGTVTAYLVLAFIRIIDVKRFVDIGINWKKLIGNTIIIMLQVIITSVGSVGLGISASVLLMGVFLILNKEELVMAVNFALRRGQHHV